MYIKNEKYLIEKIIKYNESDVEIAKLNIDSYYVVVERKKKRGFRTIFEMIPDTELYKIQRNLLKNFFAQIPLPICVKGFAPGTSYPSFLQEHAKRKYYMRLDIKDFFDSITEEQIIENLQEYVKSQESIDTIVTLCTYYGRLPQGAITSPAISNMIFRRIDQRITKYCQKFEITYTRYADDMLFSSNQLDFEKEKWFLKKIRFILKENGFQLNETKKHFDKNQLNLNGFVLTDEITLSRKKLKNINKILYYFKDKQKENKYQINPKIKEKNWLDEINHLQLKNRNNTEKRFQKEQELINYLCGYRSFLIHILHANENQKSFKLENLKNKIEHIEKVIKFVTK